MDSAEFIWSIGFLFFWLDVLGLIYLIYFTATLNARKNDCMLNDWEEEQRALSAQETLTFLNSEKKGEIDLLEEVVNKRILQVWDRNIQLKATMVLFANNKKPSLTPIFESGELKISKMMYAPGDPLTIHYKGKKVFHTSDGIDAMNRRHRIVNVYIPGEDWENKLHELYEPIQKKYGKELKERFGL